MATSTSREALSPQSSSSSAMKFDNSQDMMKMMVATRTIAITDGGRNDDDDDGGGEAFDTVVVEQNRQRQETEKDEDGVMRNPKTKKKNPSRPRLKPITCNDDADDTNIDNPSLSVTCARDLGFGSFMVTVPSSSTSSASTCTKTAATTTLEKKVEDTRKDSTNNADGIEIGASSSSTTSSSSLNDEIDTESHSDLAKQNSTISLTTSTATTNTTSSAAPITAKPKPVRRPNQQLLQRQSHHIAPKLQPKSTVFSSPDKGGVGSGGGNNNFSSLLQKSPDYDDDGYGVFGFGLISASKERKNEWTTNNAMNDSSASEVEVGEDNNEDEEGGETSDATFDNSSSSSSWIASRVVQGGRRGRRRRRGGKHASRISSITLSRVTSADSYISDDSTTSSDHQQHPEPQPQHHCHDHCNNGPTTNDANLNNRQDLLRHGSSLSSSNTNNFSVLSRKNSLHTQTSSRSLTLHLMSSDRGDDDGTCNGDSITSMDSSLAAPSHVESSYFGQARTLHLEEQQLQQQLQQGRPNQPTRSAAAFSHQTYNANDVASQYNSRGSIAPLTTKSTRQLIARTRPSPTPDDDVVELILSLSEESGERNLLHSATTTGRTYNNTYISDMDADAQQKQPRVESLTPSSIDDQVISNELRSYFRRISSPGTDSVSPSPPPPFTSSNTSGRQPPIRNRHVDSVVSQYHNIDDEGQRKLGGLLAVPTTSAANPRDLPFLTNLQMINSQASYGSVIHNLQGGNCTSEEEVEAQQQRSRYCSQSGKSISSVCTPESKPTTSLAYSDKEGLACNDRRLIPSNLDEWKEDRAMAEERTEKPKIYTFRWIMMIYMTVLHMLSGWTCFSIAPFSEVVVDSLGIDPAYLVAAFFTANFVSSAFEPMVLRRLGLRRSVLLGALLLMTGNMINGSTPGASKLGYFDVRRAFLGFIFAGLSGPLYQNTSAILITSWFPRKEKRTATDVVLCGNQLGIICSFIFGSLLVKTSDDVLPYFHKLSVISMFVFVGAAMQLSDCPPTPPSGMARVIRGTVERPLVAVVKLAPPFTFVESNEFIDTIASECVTLLSAHTQEGMNATTLLPYGSTDPFATRPAFSADRQVMKSSATERNYDVDDVSGANPASRVGDDPPREAIPVHPGLQFYHSDFDFNFQPKDYLPPTSDDGVEPTITQTNLLNMEVCDDQLWRALRACISHEGFLPCLSAYASSKIVINSLSTFMCYFTLDVGIIGCIFQLTVLASSVLCRKLAGKTRLYYMIIGLVALGTLSLALCGVNLDSEVSFTFNLLMLALFVGPLQPLSTTLG